MQEDQAGAQEKGRRGRKPKDKPAEAEAGLDLMATAGALPFADVLESLPPSEPIPDLPEDVVHSPGGDAANPAMLEVMPPEDEAARERREAIDAALENLYPRQEREEEALPEPTIEERAELAARAAIQEDIDSILQAIEQVIPPHRDVILANGHRSAAIALGGIVSAARTARKNLDSTPYWKKKVYK